MSPKSRSHHTEEILASLTDRKDAERFTAARALLQRHLIHTRDILNGKDFLFSGPSGEIHDALKTLIEIEHQTSRFLQFDFALIDEFFLLRIAGEEKFREVIEGYFE